MEGKKKRCCEGYVENGEVKLLWEMNILFHNIVGARRLDIKLVSKTDNKIMYSCGHY